MSFKVLVVSLIAFGGKIFFWYKQVSITSLPLENHCHLMTDVLQVFVKQCLVTLIYSLENTFGDINTIR